MKKSTAILSLAALGAASLLSLPAFASTNDPDPAMCTATSPGMKCKPNNQQLTQFNGYTIDGTGRFATNVLIPTPKDPKAQNFVHCKLAVPARSISLNYSVLNASGVTKSSGTVKPGQIATLTQLKPNWTIVMFQPEGAATLGDAPFTPDRHHITLGGCTIK